MILQDKYQTFVVEYICIVSLRAKPKYLWLVLSNSVTVNSGVARVLLHPILLLMCKWFVFQPITEFHAKPVPDHGAPLPPKHTKPITTPIPFQLEVETRGAMKAEEWSSKVKG